MLYPAMNKLTEYIPNRYMMVNVVARRARQIAEEAEEAGRISFAEFKKLYRQMKAEEKRKQFSPA